MKRLGRNERIGAAVLAAVSLAIVLFAFLSRRCSRSGGETDTVMSSLRELTEIRGGNADSVSVSGVETKDTSAGIDTAGDLAGNRRRRGTKNKTEGRSKKKNGTSGSRRSSSPATPRDFLKEKITVRENPDTCSP